jgi:iron complex transport system substrate-binding protein
MSLSAPTPPPRARTVSVTVLIVLLLVVGGLAIAGTAAYLTLRPTHTAPAANPSNTPKTVTVTDDLGRTVTVPYDPNRTVVLGASIMDIMFRLGLRSHVVGVDCYAAADGGLAEDYSPDQISLWGLTSSMCVQTGPTFVPEMLANETPQVVLAATIVSVAMVEEITSQLHIPVVMLQAPTLSGVLVDDDLVAEIFNATAAATTLNAQLSVELANVTNFTSNLYTLPTVLVTYSVDANGYWTFGPGSFGESLIELAGAESISANTSTPYPELTPAQVIFDNPSWIIYGTGFGLNESTYAGAPDWSAIPAVAAGNITGMDSNWITEVDPTMILVGLPALVNVLHPVSA